jgi:hypothetical protein
MPLVDPALDTPYGPYVIQKIGTVSVPKELQAEVGIGPGGRVHWVMNPDMPGTLVLVPSGLMARAMPDLLERLRHVGR